MSAANALQLLVAAITLGAVYGLVALGFVTIYRCSGVVNFAQGEFAMLGALMTIYLLKVGTLPYPASAVLAVVFVVLVGVLVHQLVVAPLRRASLLSLIMATLGVSLFVQNAALVAWGPRGAALPAFSGSEPIRFGEVAIVPQSLWVIAMAVVVLVALYLLNNRTTFGKKMTATATQPLAAGLVGISTGSMIRWSFAISSAVGALAGLFLAAMVPMNFASGTSFGLKGFIAAVLGGWGKASGAMVGGLALGIIETYAAGFLPTGYKDAISFLVLILILYYRPSGIMGASLAEAE